MTEYDPKDWPAFIIGALACLFLFTLPFAAVYIFIAACSNIGQNGW